MDNDLKGISNTGNNIIGLSEQLENNLKRFNNVIEKLGTCWQGEDAKVYIETLRDNYFPQLQKIVDAIESYGIYLKNVSKIYNDIETNALSENEG